MKYNHSVRVCSMKRADMQVFSSASLRFIKSFTDTINCKRAFSGTGNTRGSFFIARANAASVFSPMTHMLSIAAGPELGVCDNPSGGGLDKTFVAFSIELKMHLIEIGGSILSKGI